MKYKHTHRTAFRGSPVKVADHLVALLGNLEELLLASRAADFSVPVVVSIHKNSGDRQHHDLVSSDRSLTKQPNGISARATTRRSTDNPKKHVTWTQLQSLLHEPQHGFVQHSIHKASYCSTKKMRLRNETMFLDVLCSLYDE